MKKDIIKIDENVELHYVPKKGKFKKFDIIKNVYFRKSDNKIGFQKIDNGEILFYDITNLYNDFICYDSLFSIKDEKYLLEQGFLKRVQSYE